ncbi:uncharacterized protein LOC111695635 isoform X3 [Eurytemora carolleeae]|uniref:uncharacterized protein LOC111695635 isoform X3 n=1 Tax=Eurytemora carolleeae TaxID=1294199 RepID=UPI000C765D83|nr:uncharacterized protein LOC111695635 isoform X3 [Eurytemora carolleeae]|eukprot:XP_023320788.1 uncharacterized protein LOC111695635 isoform X3 [Eurytemora affinis]
MDQDAKLLELGLIFDRVEHPPEIMEERKACWERLFTKSGDSENDMDRSKNPTLKYKVSTPKTKNEAQNLSGLKSTGLSPTLRRTVLSPINGARKKDTGLSSSLASPKRFKLVERTPFSSTPTLENEQGVESFKKGSHLRLCSTESSFNTTKDLKEETYFPVSSPDAKSDTSFDFSSLPSSDDIIYPTKSQDKNFTPTIVPSSQPKEKSINQFSTEQSEQSQGKPNQESLSSEMSSPSTPSTHQYQPDTLTENSSSQSDKSRSEGLQSCVLCQGKTCFPEGFKLPENLNCGDLTLACDICVTVDMHKDCSCENCAKRLDWMTYRWAHLDQFLNQS